MAVEGGTVLLLYSNNRARGLPPHMTLHRTPVGVLLGTCSCVLTPGLGAVQVIGYVVLLYCMWGHVLVGGKKKEKGPSPRASGPRSDGPMANSAADRSVRVALAVVGVVFFFLWLGVGWRDLPATHDQKHALFPHPQGLSSNRVLAA